MDSAFSKFDNTGPLLTKSRNLMSVFILYNSGFQTRCLLHKIIFGVQEQKNVNFYVFTFNFKILFCIFFYNVYDINTVGIITQGLINGICNQ